MLVCAWLMLACLGAVGAARAEAGEMAADWNATARYRYPEGRHGLRTLEAVVTVPEALPAAVANVAVFVGVAMDPLFRGYAPVAAGTLLLWNGTAWRACVAHMSSANDYEDPFLYWTHVLDAAPGDEVRATMRLADRSAQALEYTTAIGAAHATEHVFLANNRRISGFLVGVFVPPHTHCAALEPGQGALCRLQRLVPLWDTACTGCAWVYDPAPNTGPNECGASVSPVFATIPYLQAIFRN